MVLGKVTAQLIDQFVGEIYKPQNKERLRFHILDPVASYIENYLKPYFLTLLVFLFIMIILLFYNINLLRTILQNSEKVL